MKKILSLTSPARIHLGFLDLSKDSSRKYGSIGLTITKFYFKLQIESSDKFEVLCSDESTKTKILEIIKILEKDHYIKNFKLTVLNCIPSHCGLGSGTQIALSVGYLISKFNGLKLSINQIAYLLKRGKRSGIGIESFKNGGFNIDVGKLNKSKKTPLNILNVEWPKEWRILMIFDKNIQGIHGNKEIQKFKNLNKINNHKTNYNFKALLMNIIPGIFERNFNEFANGIRTIQDMMSDTFYGSSTKYASKKIEKIFQNIKKKGVKCFGQTSWGPTGFVFFENSKKRNELSKYLEKYITLNKMFGVEIIKVEGKNSGKLLKTNKG